MVLLLDRDAAGYHSLYRLGEHNVIFKDWESLWEAVSRYRKAPASVAGFGDCVWALGLGVWF